MNTALPGNYILLVSKKNEQYLVPLKEKGHFSTHEGNLAFADIIGATFGTAIKTHLGATYHLFQPTIYNYLRFIKRKTQVLYAKDLGYIILRLNIMSGKRVIECGSGSGSATSAFAFSLFPDGKLSSYEAREEFSRLARENVRRLGLEHIVDFKVKDIEAGFDETDADALFLDVKFPEKYILQAKNALKSGGDLCVFVPTTNQVCDTLKALEEHNFFNSDVVEIMLRNYKTVPERLRPEDNMIAHTGYLIFSKKVTGTETEAVHE